jgi:uroporphyrinogen-III synthase
LEQKAVSGNLHTMQKTPLNGKRIVVTRPEGQATAALRAALETRGATVLEIPLIDIEYTADASALEDVWSSIGQFDWILFTSANGVRGFFDRFFESFNDIRGIGLARFACVGRATAEALRALHLNTDFQPSEATAEALVRELSAAEDLAHLRVLVVTGNRNTEDLPAALEEKCHAIVTRLTVYATMENDAGQLDAAESFRRHGADAILFASPSAADSFVAQAKVLTPGKNARLPKAVAIGSTTADALREHGIPVSAIATTPAPEDFVEAAIRALAGK